MQSSSAPEKIPSPSQTSIGIFNSQGQLVRQWAFASSRPAVPQAWDGLDDQGRPVPPGKYRWKSVSLDSRNLRSRWVMSPGAHPARNSNGHLMYFPGAIVGATHVQADGDILYIGAPVGDASDILMQTDLQATRSHWVKDLITQRAINHVSSMSLGGREGKELFIFQSPNHIIVLDASGQQRTATQISANHSKKWHASLAANHEFVAVSYPDENLIRYYSAQDLQPAGEIAAASPEKLCFLQDTGKNIAFVSADEKKVYRIVEGKTSMVRADIADPVVLRRWKNTLLIGSSDGHYRQKENPEAHQRIDEESISPTGSQIYFVSPGDKIEKSSAPERTITKARGILRISME
ncbi:FlgD immunoglobulin-like domain containing protein [Oscillatoria laete-virens NRMC-F 0139]|nr:FlgD immunoglobulin-like domain containing protein [Oscillatoria laete-virens NRMC-F 0139]